MTGSFLQAVRGPVLLVTLGLLMTADQLGRMSFSRTWPVLLILFGLFKLIDHLGTKNAAPPDLNQDDPGGTHPGATNL